MIKILQTVMNKNENINNINQLPQSCQDEAFFLKNTDTTAIRTVCNGPLKARVEDRHLNL